ncbi:MAG: hypothetical protein HY737_01980 [Candidatus Omnitrophica bacterium]|nr:hypothetical protein [Candidatus Omnitrophota bacterium]
MNHQRTPGFLIRVIEIIAITGGIFGLARADTSQLPQPDFTTSTETVYRNTTMGIELTIPPGWYVPADDEEPFLHFFGCSSRSACEVRLDIWDRAQDKRSGYSEFLEGRQQILEPYQLIQGAQVLKLDQSRFPKNKWTQSDLKFSYDIFFDGLLTLTVGSNTDAVEPILASLKYLGKPQARAPSTPRWQIDQEERKKPLTRERCKIHLRHFRDAAQAPQNACLTTQGLRPFDFSLYLPDDAKEQEMHFLGEEAVWKGIFEAELQHGPVKGMKDRWALYESHISATPHNRFEKIVAGKYHKGDFVPSLLDLGNRDIAVMPHQLESVHEERFGGTTAYRIVVQRHGPLGSGPQKPTPFYYMAMVKGSTFIIASYGSKDMEDTVRNTMRVVIKANPL